MLQRFLDRIARKQADVSAAPVLMVAAGDSVTQGCMALDVMDPQGVYHHQLQRMLEARFPLTTFSVINAGVGGDNATGVLARLERDVLRHQPDLLLLALGLNDACVGDEHLPDFLKTMEQILERTRRGCEADILLLTPTALCARDNPLVAAVHRQAGYVERFIELWQSRVVSRYAQAIRDLGTRQNLPVADVHALWQTWEGQSVDITARLSNGLNHPDAASHRHAAQVIMNLLPAQVPAA